jgi:hypothetical protein
VTLTLWRLGLAPSLILVMAPAIALAQATNYSKVEATVGKPLQLGYYASAHKNCTPAHLATIRVIDAPKSGTLTVRRAELTTDKIQGCPPLKIPALVAFYQARAGGTGSDHLAYEVTSEDGQVNTYNFTIGIVEPKPPLPADNKENKI